MVQQKKRSHKRIMTVLVALCMVFVSIFAFTGCESKHPKASVTISFEGSSGVKTYTLKYKLYRNIYSKTVRRFIELADDNYYDGMVIHDYDSTKMVTGAYYYEDKDSAYDELVEKALPDGLTKSVYNGETELNTLYGEFEANGFRIKNSGVDWDYGNLFFNYDEVSYAGQVLVDVKDSNNKLQKRDYKFNAATSQFGINLNTGTSSADKCCFGELENEDVLEDLIAYIDLYKEDMKEEDSSYTFTENVDKTVYSNDVFADEIDVTYAVPVQRIIIKSVEITKH